MPPVNDREREAEEKTNSLSEMAIRQRRDSLIDVVMQLSRDPCALFFLCLNQFAPNVRESFLGQLAVRNVHARADVSGKGPVVIESRNTIVEDPTVLSVVPSQPVLHLERLPAVERLHIRSHAGLYFIRVHCFYPAVV